MGCCLVTHAGPEAPQKPSSGRLSGPWGPSQEHLRVPWIELLLEVLRNLYIRVIFTDKPPNGSLCVNQSGKPDQACCGLSGAEGPAPCPCYLPGPQVLGRAGLRGPFLLPASAPGPQDLSATMGPGPYRTRPDVCSEQPCTPRQSHARQTARRDAQSRPLVTGLVLKPRVPGTRCLSG